MDRSAYEEMARVEAGHWWFAGRRQIAARLLHHFFGKVPARILEIGCGTGGNLEMLQQRGQVTAVEMEESACAHVLGRGLHDLRLHHASFPDCTELLLDEGQFGTICLFDVLEHLQDDTTALSACAHLLAPGGRIMITVPAYSWLWSPHDEKLHHKRRYTRRTLLAAAGQAGLHPVYLGYFNTLLMPLLVTVRLADRLLQRTQATGSAPPPPAINRAFRQLLALESRVIPRWSLPFGSTLVAVLEK